MINAISTWLLFGLMRLVAVVADEEQRYAPAGPVLPRPTGAELVAEVHAQARLFERWAELERLKVEAPMQYLAAHGSLLGLPCRWRNA